MVLLCFCACSSDIGHARSGIYIYEDIEDPTRPSAQSIIFEPSRNNFYMYRKMSVNYSIGQETDSGGLFKIERSGSLLFDRISQILIPEKVTSNEWSGFGYSCKARMRSKEMDVTCVSLKDNSKYSKFTYEEDRGVTAMLSSCTYKIEGCMYGLRSREGIFSREMRSHVSSRETDNSVR